MKDGFARNITGQVRLGFDYLAKANFLIIITQMNSRVQIRSIITDLRFIAQTSTTTYCNKTETFLL
ncbi:hypothetical protein HHX48_13005 [Salinimonas sp. HHU 13199]|uniref:Uncharacterized protein n=1 Tax=Salinimonas profundi TaxID=2729140 RepID=A0ABR8LKD8_9ALTE|nr:hypothetical protein [Salinimonas profundi]MBD3586660.1 hypothetical protein [Salinimonas profundi]